MISCSLAKGDTQAKTASKNRFAILDIVSDIEEEESSSAVAFEDQRGLEDICIEQRKSRAAAAGVAELMRTLKPKKKGPIDKGKIKQSKVGYATLGGQNPSTSS